MHSFCLLTSMEPILITICSLLKSYSNVTEFEKFILEKVIAINTIVIYKKKNTNKVGM